MLSIPRKPPAVAGALIVAVAALVLVLVMAGVGRSGDNEQPLPDRPLGEAPTSALNAESQSETLPAEVAAAAAFAGDELGDTTAAPVAGPRGSQLYLAQSPRAATRFCAVARGGEGGLTSVLCGNITDIGTGLVTLPQQLEQGQGGPTVIFGLAPDGYVSATVDGARVPITKNVYSTLRPDGAPLKEVIYERSDGSKVPISLPGG